MKITEFNKKVEVFKNLGIKYRIFKADAKTEITNNILLFSDSYSDGLNFVQYKEAVYYIPNNMESKLTWYSWNEPRYDKFNNEVMYAKFKLHDAVLLSNTLLETLISLNTEKVENITKVDFEFATSTIDLVNSIKEKEDNVVAEFRDFFTKLITKYEEKSKEYTSTSWKENFVKGARIRGKNPEQIALDYLTKHLVSIIDIIDGKEASKELIDEKIGDLQIYLFIIRKLLHERK